MSLAIVFAVAAHSEPESLVAQAENLAAACPHSRVVVFDGASDPSWRANIDLPFASQSRPLRHGYLSDFHYLVMQDVLHRYPDFDCLVTLDSDVLAIKAGLEDQLGGLLKDFAYVGARLHPLEGRTEWSTARRFMYHWPRYWQPLLQISQPWGAFNPGQVFRRDVVERVVADATVPPLLDAVRKARATALEEIVYPSLVVGRGFAGTSHPGAHALDPPPLHQRRAGLVRGRPVRVLGTQGRHRARCAGSTVRDPVRRGEGADARRHPAGCAGAGLTNGGVSLLAPHRGR